MAFILRKPKGFLGIDFGSHSIKIAEVVQGIPPELRSFGQVKLPLEGSFEENIELIIEKLKKLTKNLNIKTKKVIASISSYATITKRLTMTITDEKDIEDIIKEEAEAQIPFDLNDVYYDYHIVDTDEDKVEFTIAASKKEAIERVIEIIEEMDLELLAIKVDVIEAGNLFEFLYKPQKPNLLIDFGSSKTTLTIWEKECFYIIRDFSTGTEELWKKLTEELGIKENEIKNKNIEKNEIIKNWINEYKTKIIDQIKETILRYQEERKKEIDSIYIYGGGSLIIDPKIIENKTKIKTESIDIFSRINYTKINNETINYINKIGIVATALATSSLAK